MYVASLTALFTASALYHRRTWSPRARLFMKRMDHAAIFILIAGAPPLHGALSVWAPKLSVWATKFRDCISPGVTV